MPATTDYLPRRESELVQWSANFDAQINASAVSYGLTAAQATVYNGLHVAFQTAWQIANANGTRTPSAIQTKNLAKEALISDRGGIRELAGIVQSFPGTTNTERSDLGLTVRDSEPTPIPPPTVEPGLAIVSAFGRTVKVRLYDAASPSSRAKPAGVQGASVYSYVGATAPADIESWTYEGSTTRLSFDVEFPATVANGATAWFSAYWTNPKLQSGPPCQPVSTNIPGGLSMAA